jgi:hypothetical protein
MPENLVSNAEWSLIKQDDGTLLLQSADGTIKVVVTKQQLLSLRAIADGAQNV